MAKNSFAMKLQELMQLSGVKSAVLARAVQYDLSYISKWLSGKMLPSEKNIDEVMDSIGDCLLSGKTDKLEEHYGCVGIELKQALIVELHSSYDKCKSNTEPDQFLSSKPVSEMVHTITKRLSTAESVLSMIDLLSMPHESRLILAGIKGGHFCLPTNAKKYDMVISLHSEDCVYDCIFLVHMMTGFSGINFNLYNSSIAEGKLLYCIDNSALSGFLFPDNKDCVAVGLTESGGIIRQNIIPFVNQENLIFRHITMEEMIRNREYIQTLLSTNICWLIGHATELLLPQDVFDELAEKREDKSELKKFYLLSQSVLVNKSARVMVYESVLANLAVDGILDFYNHPIELSSSQRVKCLSYYEDLVKNGVRISLIDGGFSDDFRYITNPCMFLSDSLCYLRLENNRYHNNILQLNNKTVKSLFYSFFETVWTSRADVVTFEKEGVIDKIHHYQASAVILNQLP